MQELLIAVLIFLCLAGAAVGSSILCDFAPIRQKSQDTHDVVRLAAGIFVLMASLALGFFVNSAKNSFEQINNSVHVFATEIILLDRTLRQLGPEGDGARKELAGYAARARAGTWPARGSSVIDDNTAERMLDRVDDLIRALPADNGPRDELVREAKEHLHKVVERRWSLIAQSGGSIPSPLLLMLVTWLMLVFASFGYRAPRNWVVITTLVASAALIAGSIYLILDMNRAFDGPIQVSPEPLDRAIQHIAGRAAG